MRTHGTLKKWNEDRGFGFISPAQGGEDIFVHISAFPRDGVRPRVNELISFETEAGTKNKLQAVRILRPIANAGNVGAARSSRRPRSLLAVLAVAAISIYGYSRINNPVNLPATTPASALVPAVPTTNFKCDGRTLCSQMTSCAEATYFLQHCPNTQMDGNNDGEPCEQQWCR